MVLNKAIVEKQPSDFNSRWSVRWGMSVSPVQFAPVHQSRLSLIVALFTFLNFSHFACRRPYLINYLLNSASWSSTYFSAPRTELDLAVGSLRTDHGTIKFYPLIPMTIALLFLLEINDNRPNQTLQGGVNR